MQRKKTINCYFIERDSASLENHAVTNIRIVQRRFGTKQPKERAMKLRFGKKQLHRNKQRTQTPEKWLEASAYKNRPCDR